MNLRCLSQLLVFCFVLFLRQSLTGPGVQQLAKLADKQGPESSCIHLPQPLGLQSQAITLFWLFVLLCFMWVSRGPNSGLHDCIADTLLTEPSLQPLLLISNILKQMEDFQSGSYLLLTHICMWFL